MKTIYVLWERQLKRYYRSKVRMIASLAQPLLFLVAFGFGFGPIYNKASGGNYIDFLVPGIIAMSVLFSSTFMGIEVIWDRQFGFLKETLVAPVSRFKIMLGRTLGGATVATFQGLIVLLLSMIIGFRPKSIESVILSIFFMALIAIIFTALGTAIASQLEDMHAFQLIINFLIMPLFFLSGALFPLQGVPKFITVLSSINPLSYGVDALRGAMTGNLHFGLIFDAVVLSGVAVLFLSIGAYFFSKIEA